jgi:hypothetical protein
VGIDADHGEIRTAINPLRQKPLCVDFIRVVFACLFVGQRFQRLGKPDLAISFRAVDLPEVIPCIVDRDCYPVFDITEICEQLFL